MPAYPNNQSNPGAATPIWIAPPPAGSGLKSGAAVKNIAANGNTQVKTGPGTFYGLSVNTPGLTSSATVYDGTDNTGVKIGAYSTLLQGGPNIPARGYAFTVGLFVVTAGGTPADVTVGYD